MPALVNGSIPTALLVPLSTPGTLDILAAASYERVKALTGLTGTTIANHAYRSLEEQVDVLHDYYTTTPNTNRPVVIYGGHTWYRKPGHPTAAKPGTSNHGWGRAVDWQNLGGFDGAGYKKLAAIGPTHGWSNTEGKQINEAWHWVYDPANDHHTEDDMTPEQAKLLNDIATQTGWTVKRLSGSVNNDSITKLLQQILVAVTAGSPAIDYAALAKAVNDDAARRLAK